MAKSNMDKYTTNFERRSKDGKLYPTYSEKLEADSRYAIKQELEKNNDLLEKQNKKIEEYVEDNNELMKENINSLMMQEQSRNSELLDKIENEKFLNIGISRNIFEKYIEKYRYKDEIDMGDTLFNMEYLISELTDDKEAILNKDIRKVNRIYDFLDESNYKSNTTELTKNEKKFLYDFNSRQPNALSFKLMSDVAKLRKYENILIIPTFGWILLFIIALFILPMIIVINTADVLNKTLVIIISIIPTIIWLLSLFKYIKYANNILKKTSNEIINKSQKLQEYDYDKLETDINKLINEKKKEYIDKKKEYISYVSDDLKKFDKFRISHYNKNVEALIIDSELQDYLENLGLKLEMVNNKNKVADGTVDDYVAFFEENI